MQAEPTPNREPQGTTVATADGRSRWLLLIATFVSSLGGFLFGDDNIVSSGAIGYLAKNFQLDAAGVG